MTGGRVRGLTGAAGLAAVLALAAGWVFLPDDPPGPAATAEQVVRWTLADRRSLLVATVLLAAGLGGLVVFFAGLRSLCARAEGAPGLFATIGWGSMLIAISIVYAALGLAQTQSFLALDAEPSTVEAFHDGRLLLANLAGMPAAFGLVAFGIAMVRTAFPARALGVLAGLVAISQLGGVIALSHDGFFSPAGGAARLGVIGVVAWVAVVAGVLLWRPVRPSDGSLTRA